VALSPISARGQVEERKLCNWMRGAIIERELLLRVATLSPLIERDFINLLTEYTAKRREKRKRESEKMRERKREKTTLATIIFHWRTRARLRGQKQARLAVLLIDIRSEKRDEP